MKHMRVHELVGGRYLDREEFARHDIAFSGMARIWTCLIDATCPWFHWEE